MVKPIHDLSDISNDQSQSLLQMTSELVSAVMNPGVEKPLNAKPQSHRSPPGWGKRTESVFPILLSLKTSSFCDEIQSPEANHFHCKSNPLGSGMEGNFFMTATSKYTSSAPHKKPSSSTGRKRVLKEEKF